MKKLLSVFIAAVFVLPVSAQDTGTPLHPEFSAETTFSSGLFNIDKNETVKEIPGLSSGYDANIDVSIKGSFARAGEWAVEKEDGIEARNGIGYEAALGIDLSVLENAVNGTSDYKESSNTNHYSLIQPMIDWYESSWRKYGLPSPRNLGFVKGKPWPTTKYGMSDDRYQFIKGSTVEKASDVIWTNEKWAAGEALYEDIKYKIASAIDALDASLIGTGEVNELDYKTYSDELKKKSELKMKAKREFDKVAKGNVSSSELKDSVSSAYIKITNIAGLFDTRIDFLGKRLTVGKNITSYIAGQTEKGSAVEVSLKHGLINGLSFGLSAGIAGGKNQEPENYDTTALDYYEGLDGELAFKAGARYNLFVEPLSTNVLFGAEGVLSDAFVAEKNFAFDAYARIERAGFISFDAGVEGLFLNYKNREEDDSDYESAFSFAADASVRMFGLCISADGRYKTKYFSHETYNTTEDRFYGYTVDSDYYVANLKDAALAKVKCEFNPKYFISYDLIDIFGSAEVFMYDSKINGIGAEAGAEIGFEDLFNIPVTIFGKAHYYKNSELTEWDDYKNLPEQEFIDFTQIRAGVKFNPVKQLELSCEYVTSPSYSRYNSERISSLTLNGKVKLD
ncbi:MAG: hypothetical protein J5780_03645 [Treponema sp.]|nr:hypothetical protein [Treponema sp.]